MHDSLVQGGSPAGPACPVLSSRTRTDTTDADQYENENIRVSCMHDDGCPRAAGRDIWSQVRLMVIRQVEMKTGRGLEQPWLSGCRGVPESTRADSKMSWGSSAMRPNRLDTVCNGAPAGRQVAVPRRAARTTRQCGYEYQSRHSKSSSMKSSWYGIHPDLMPPIWRVQGTNAKGSLGEFRMGEAITCCTVSMLGITPSGCRVRSSSVCCFPSSSPFLYIPL